MARVSHMMRPRLRFLESWNKVFFGLLDYFWGIIIKRMTLGVRVYKRL